MLDDIVDAAGEEERDLEYQTHPLAQAVAAKKDGIATESERQFRKTCHETDYFKREKDYFEKLEEKKKADLKNTQQNFLVPKNGVRRTDRKQDEKESNDDLKTITFSEPKTKHYRQTS